MRSRRQHEAQSRSPKLPSLHSTKVETNEHFRSSQNPSDLLFRSSSNKIPKLRSPWRIQRRTHHTEKTAVESLQSEPTPKCTKRCIPKRKAASKQTESNLKPKISRIEASMPQKQFLRQCAISGGGSSCFSFQTNGSIISC